MLYDLLNNIPLGRLTKQKMMTINEIIHSELFLFPKSRKILLPLITHQVKILFEAKEEVSKRIMLSFTHYLISISI